MSVETRPKVADVFRGAARLIEEYGWQQGQFSGPRYCLLSSVECAASQESDWFKARELTDPNPLVATLAAILGVAPERYELTGWNDEEGRTRTEVIAALNAAADAAEQS